jgi:hypothetical protein
MVGVLAATAAKRAAVGPSKLVVTWLVRGRVVGRHSLRLSPRAEAVRPGAKRSSASVVSTTPCGGGGGWNAITRKKRKV